MNVEEARALGREITEIANASGDTRRHLTELFQRYQVRDLDDDLRKQAQACKAQTLWILEIASRPKDSTEVIAGVTVAHFGNSREILECCGELNVLVRRYFSWTGGNSRWGFREDSYSRYELLSHEDAISWIQQALIPANDL